MKKRYIIPITLSCLFLVGCGKPTFEQLKKEHPICTELFVKVYGNWLSCYQTNTGADAIKICQKVNKTSDLKTLSSPLCQSFFKEFDAIGCLSKQEESNSIQTITCLFDTIGYTGSKL